jgi:hypothetical protein
MLVVRDPSGGRPVVAYPEHNDELAASMPGSPRSMTPDEWLVSLGDEGGGIWAGEVIPAVRCDLGTIMCSPGAAHAQERRMPWKPQDSARWIW